MPDTSLVNPPVIGKFFLIDECETHGDIKKRNVLFITINCHDSIKSYYQDNECADYSKTFLQLHDTNEISNKLPTALYCEYDDKYYIRRKLTIFIYSEMLPDTLKNKTSWKTLFRVTNDVINTIKRAKNQRAISVFQTEYNTLTLRQKSFIDKLVPTSIFIYLFDII